MSNENDNLGDDIKKGAEEVFDSAKEAAKKAKHKAGEFAEEAKETAEEFMDEMKETFESNENKKILAGVLALVVGGFGIHKFVLGYHKEGIIMLVCTLILGAVTCGFAGWVVWVISIIEGIIYLTKSDEEFYQVYQINKKSWF
ncbi:TM2 domain-containing protein [Aquimarina sp. SS2-1]|uniref:TM2 domain-containing protein n=1 Tax=Aquimarina besae TaxID=3342247 RepID=UPI00366AF315